MVRATSVWGLVLALTAGAACSEDRGAPGTRVASGGARTAGPAAGTGGGTVPLRGAGALEQLVWGYPRMRSGEILARLRRLSAGDRALLGSFNQLSTDLYMRACQANPGLVFRVGGSAFNCSRLRADLRQAFRFGLTPQSWRGEVQNQRLKIVNSRRCARGELDRVTCARYYQTLRRTGAMRHDTNQRIIENIGNKCRVGVDPGCRY